PTPTTTQTPTTQPTNLVCPTSIWSSSYRIVAGTGTKGNAPALLSNPTYVVFDGLKNMHVVDQSNHRVQKFAEGT
ncbi:unnamed protein product, partial [Rotaria socialis]